MEIWVDADACPKVIKDILFRAARRVRVQLTLVANRHLGTPPSPYIRSIQVPGGFDVADNRIVHLMQPGDLVVTADIPLAALVVEKGGLALDPRGDLYTESNIGERVAVRDLMDQLRSAGEISGGPSAIGKRDRQRFADQLDRLLTKHVNSGSR
jgi:uncharacterized protein YaiI (UPF0178 family)